MKVLQINSVCGIGSTGKIATDIHNILIKHGNKSYIAYGRNSPKNCDNAIKIGGQLDNYGHVVLTRIFDKHGFGSKQATIEFIKKVTELKPDIIHLQNIHGYYINIEMLFKYLKAANIPVVWTLHDCWSFTGHCAYFDFVGCDKWKVGCNRCPQKKTYPESLIIDNSINNYLNKKTIFSGVKNLTIVTPSKWLESLVKESYLSNYPTVVINNGINLDAFKPTKSEFKEKYNIENKFIALGVASEWDKRKGLDDFIKLSEIVDERIQIVLVGLSEKQKKQINKISSKILTLSRTDSLEELVAIYTSADVFVNPTYEDNFPTTNLEALACGTPVITYNTGGSIESINEKCGYIVEKGNIKNIYNKINEVREKGKSYYLDNCVQHANKFYNMKERFIEYVDMYQDLIDKNI